MNKYILMILTGACSFGILSTFVKLAYMDGYSAAEVSVSQAAIGMLVLWALAIQRTPDEVRKLASLSFKAKLQLLTTGAAIGLTTFTYYVSVKYITASLAIVLLMQFTWFGPLLDWLFYKKKPKKNELVATCLILFGTALASGKFHFQTSNISAYGIFMALFSAALYSVYIFANGRINVQIDSLTKSAVFMTGSAAGIFLLNAAELLSTFHIEAALMRWSLFLAVFGTIIPPVLFARAIPKTGVSLSAILLTAELPVAVVCSHLILHERFTAMQWIGTSVMLAAIALLKLPKRKMV